jgi:hypothetical protein
VHEVTASSEKSASSATLHFGLPRIPRLPLVRSAEAHRVDDCAEVTQWHLLLHPGESGKHDARSKSAVYAASGEEFRIRAVVVRVVAVELILCHRAGMRSTWKGSISFGLVKHPDLCLPRH